jgi:adhesin HecA-like repeat protein
MPDVVYDHLSGVLPQQGMLKKAMPDGSFAPVSMGIAGFAPLLSLSAVSAVGPGSVLDNVGVRSNHSTVVNTNGTVTTGGGVQLQGSQDNVNWANLLTTAINPVSGTATVYSGTATLTPFRFLRAAVTLVIPGGGTVSAWVASAG